MQYFDSQPQPLVVRITQYVTLNMDLYELATAEVFGEPIPMAAGRATDKRVARPSRVLIDGFLVGDQIPAVNLTLNYYRCQGADRTKRDKLPFATEVLNTGGVSLPAASLVTNGNFALGTGWNLGAGWSIGAGVATFDGQDRLAGGFLSQPVTLGTAFQQWFLLRAVLTGFTGGKLHAQLHQTDGAGRPKSEKLGHYYPIVDDDATGLPTRKARLFMRRAADSAEEGSSAWSSGAQLSFEPLLDGLDNFLPMALSIDDIRLQNVTANIYRFSRIKTIDDCGDGLVLGFLPAASMAETFLSCTYQRLVDE